MNAGPADSPAVNSGRHQAASLGANAARHPADSPVGFGSSDVPLAARHDVALLDLDGVVYVGPHAVPGAAESLDAALDLHGMRAAFVTNNASRPPEVVAAHLTRLGLHATPSDVVISAQAGARVLAERLEPGSRVLAVGGPGVAWALKERGLEPVTSMEEDPVAVLQGFGPDVGWRQLAEASLALERGAFWVATNMDRTIPTPQGRVLGNGALVTALAHATGAVPVVAGKPEPPLMLESVERSHAVTPLVVGDRLDTDIEGANRSGLPSLLVLTGVTDWFDLLDIPDHLRPTYLGRDLTALLEPAPPVTVEQSDGQLAGRCREAQVVLPVVESTAESPADPDSRAWLPPSIPVERGAAAVDLDQVRAMVAISWVLRDRGLRPAGMGSAVLAS